jgi:hypothetical protein
VSPRRSRLRLVVRSLVALAAGALVVVGWQVDTNSGAEAPRPSRQAYSFELVRTIDEDPATRRHLVELIRQTEQAYQEEEASGGTGSPP